MEEQMKNEEIDLTEPVAEPEKTAAPAAEAEEDDVAVEEIPAIAEEQPLWEPAVRGQYSVQELSFTEIVAAIADALTGDGAMTRKQLRKRSGVKKKAFKLIEGMDENAKIGDVLKVLATMGKTLKVVPLEDGGAQELAAQTPAEDAED